MFKILNGTPKGANTTLCTTCLFGIHIKGKNLQERIHCSYMGKQLHFRVDTCSKYAYTSATTLEDMKKIAWRVETRNRGKAGFVPNAAKYDVEVNPPRESPEDGQAAPAMEDEIVKHSNG